MIQGTVTLSFSLHKFYNYCTKGEPLNWDDFTFSQANRAKTMLAEMFPILDFGQAKVMKYEVGCNVECPTPPEDIMGQIDKIVIKGREYKIVVDRSFSEYKLYGTHKKTERAAARVVYVWYDKTFEVLSKQKKNKGGHYAIPDNIMRVEKDNRVPIQKTMFLDLFKKEFQLLTRNEFVKNVTERIFFREFVPKVVPKKLEGLSGVKQGIFEIIAKDGKDFDDFKGERILRRLESDYSNGRIPRRTYYRRRGEIREVLDDLPRLLAAARQGADTDFQAVYLDLVKEKMRLLDGDYFKIRN